MAKLGILLAVVMAAPVEADVVLRGGTIFDGSGKPGTPGDVAIKGERIVALGQFEASPKAKIVDVSGLYIAPGFIDLHTHCDIGSPSLTAKAGRPNLCYLTQGVTTVVTGNCGSGPIDSAHYYDLLDQGVGTNVAHLAPHNSIRSKVMGNVNRPPTEAELAKMVGLVEKAMKDGAWGMSTGLIYNPGTYAQTEEIIALAKPVAKFNGLYASHIRNEGGGLLAAIEEALQIGKAAGVAVHISHFKSSGAKNWGKAADGLALVEKARQAGQVVTADQYPYTASSTSLSATVVPARFREGKPDDFLARLGDPQTGPEMRKAIEASVGEGKTIRIARYMQKPAWQGKSLAQIAQAESKTPVEIALEVLRGGGAQVVNFGMSEEDVRIIAQRPYVATASDGSTQVPSDSVPHPRSYGTFPRKIGRYAIEEKLLSVEAAVRSASGLPADILHLPQRGYLKVGFFADIVAFDPTKYRDLATFDKPHQFSPGVQYLFVNGRLTLENGKHNGTLAGKALRKSS